MVARMMRWRPWSPSLLSPPLNSRSFEANLVVERVEGVNPSADASKVAAEVAWKGQKARIGPLRRRGARRNLTREENLEKDGVVVWNEEFSALCELGMRKDGSFGPWEIVFTVFFAGLNQGPKKNIPLIGTASLNLAEFAGKSEKIDISIPLLLPGTNSECSPCLHLALSLQERSNVQGSPDALDKTVSSVPMSPPSDGALPLEKDEPSDSRLKFRKVKLFKGFVSNAKKNKACLSGEDSEGHCSRNDDSEPAYPCDTDTPDDDEVVEAVDNKDDFNLRRSFNYGSLASANYIGGSVYLDMITSPENEDMIYYGHQRSDVSYVTESTSDMSEQQVSYILKRSILPWRKRKLGFISPKHKGEPLLKQSYGEEGGDDIDFDRRQLSSSDESLLLLSFKGASRSLSSHFGDDHFAVGSWDSKEIVSRDGSMKLSTSVFFASIDQRSERAAGESACAVLVAIIADWFQVNQNMLPTRSEFDNLIREGSLEWRKLCENQIYRERFPDKHFDLETVLEAKIRPLTVVPDKSFVGFFSPESTDDNNTFDFLNGAMSFDNIWNEISHAGSATGVDVPQLYVVSWNDHFFILMVEKDAYYIVDTLGERLHEGCNQAYVLKFDDSTSIHRVSNDSKQVSEKVENTDVQQEEQSIVKMEDKSSPEEGSQSVSSDEELVCRGKDSCKEYIKSFLAAIPIRELQFDLKKGLTSMSIHHRLQIEFHSTELLKEITAQSADVFQGAVESDSEFSLPNESDAQFSSSPELTGDFCQGDLSWSPEPTSATSLFASSVNLEVEVK